ncbi:unnamed protein product [Ceutorhynchus assimilis]|uniref:Uncharacterized protein n=1 Tax=Ceutorhynchus assimilis TaxID=467358 RepID=A0A9N9MJB3_9CUCU|nr:unnamed protein product [Ceutorhynchus assimilis]
MPLDKNRHETWFKRNMMFIVTIPLVIGIHWGWLKLQQDPTLVDPKYRRNLPYYDMYQIAKKYFTGESAEPLPEKREDKEIFKD